MKDTSQTDKKGFDAKSFYRDTPKSGNPAAALLSTARLHLLRKFPFFGKLAMSMVFVETEDVPTTAVDAKCRFYYNPKWVNAFTFEDAVGEVAHEVMHLVQRLFARRGNRDMGIFNLAADYVADHSTVQAGIAQSFASKLMVGDKEMALVEKLKMVEPVYDHLLEDLKNNTGCPACKQALQKMQQKSKEEGEKEKANAAGKEKGEEENDGGGEGEGEGEGSDSHSHGSNGSSCKHGDGKEGDAKGGSGSGSGQGEPKHTCGNIRQCCAGTTTDLGSGEVMPGDIQKAIQNVVAAKMYAEGRGNMPGHLCDQIDELTKSKVRWQDHLRTTSNRVFAESRYSYRRPNKRVPGLPSTQKESRSAVIVVDTSGSMGHDSIKQCISESAGIILASGCNKLWLILHDCVIYYSGYVGKEDLTKLQLSPGGTSHIPVFECLNRTHPDKNLHLPAHEVVELAIMFTDLGTEFPESAPSYPVIWGVPVPSSPGMAAEVPFGKKVEVEL